MKTKIRKKAKTAGQALIVALVIGSILCITLTGYLSVVQQQTLLSARSQAWNLAITLVEAGIEEGLEHMNVNPTAPWADSWSQSGIWYYHKTTFANNNSYTVYVNITNSLQPVILCKADVQSATFIKYSALSAAPGYFFAAAGADGAARTKVNRTVQVRTVRGSLFTKAMVARNTIDMNGNDILTDSFDSLDLFKSWYGKYTPSRYVGDKGDIASNGNIVNEISIGNANIYGHVSTGPGGTATVGSGGGIGSHTWQLANPGAIQPNDAQNQWYAHDSNFTFPTTPLPYNSGTALPAGGDVAVMASSDVSSSTTTNAGYPTPPPWSGVQTNWSTTTSTTYPGPQMNLTTNTYTTNSAVYPSPVPATGVSTNYLGTTQLSGPNAPAPGANVVPGTLVDKGNSGQHNWQWTSYSSKTYTYRVAGSYTYSAPASYTYSLYTTNVVWQTNHYDSVISAPGDYYTTASSIGNVLVTAPGVRLVMPNGLNMGGSDGITIGESGSMALFSGGTSAKIAGNAVINKSGSALNFIMYCSPLVTSVDFNGNGEFIGVLVAPNAHIDMNGGGHADNDFMGAMVVESVKMNGHFKFHYDEALGRNNSNGRLLVTSWDEVDPNATLPVAN